jgi:hypothetical protein
VPASAPSGIRNERSPDVSITLIAGPPARR